MRIAPIALFSYNNYDKLLYYVKEVTEVTHSHKLGIDGAILQVTANQFLSMNKCVYLHTHILI